MLSWLSGVSWPNVGFIVLTVFSWAAIHGSLMDKKIELHTSRILLSELPPAATFSYTLVYYTLPAFGDLIFGRQGTFVQIMAVLGALMFNVSSVGWISLLGDVETDSADDLSKDE